MHEHLLIHNHAEFTIDHGDKTAGRADVPTGATRGWGRQRTDVGDLLCCMCVVAAAGATLIGLCWFMWHMPGFR